MKNACVDAGSAAESCFGPNCGGIMAHDMTFLLGDLNYRIEGGKADIQAMVAAGDWAALQCRDQVTHTLMCCRLSVTRPAAPAADAAEA